MAALNSVLGIVLAGGRSSRMGQNKALLPFRGKPLVQHMRDLIAAMPGIAQVIISGKVPQFEGVPDDSAFEGPAWAMRGIAKKFPDYAGYLFVPVDMPLLDESILKPLLGCVDGGYYESMPLPAYLPRKFGELPQENSVHAILSAIGAERLKSSAAMDVKMMNANTPDEWKKAQQ